MGLRIVLAALIPAVVLLSAACGDEDPKRPRPEESGVRPINPGGGSGTSSSGGLGDAGDTLVDSGDAGLCSDLAITGAQVAQQVIIGEPPAGTGGQLVDGIYDVTDGTLYSAVGSVPGPSGASYQGSIRLSDNGTIFERHLIFRTAGGAVVETSVKGTITTGVSSLITLTCPVAAQEQITYTVTGNNLAITNLVTKEALAFTKIP